MPQDCLDFLRSTPFLIEFRAILSPAVSRTVFNSLNGDRVLLSKLRALELRSRPLFNTIDKLTPPSLENLTLGEVALEIATPILQSFLERSRPPLARLHICRNGNADTLTPSLELLHALEFLHLQNLTISERLFRALVIPVDVRVRDLGRIFWSSLAYLVVLTKHPRSAKEACIASIFSMVKSQAEVLGTFKMVERLLDPTSEVTRLAINDEDWSVDSLRALLGDSWKFAVISSM